MFQCWVERVGVEDVRPEVGVVHRVEVGLAGVVDEIEDRPGRAARCEPARGTLSEAGGGDGQPGRLSGVMTGESNTSLPVGSSYWVLNANAVERRRRGAGDVVEQVGHARSAPAGEMDGELEVGAVGAGPCANQNCGTVSSGATRR